jgi:hypothetical protein
VYSCVLGISKVWVRWDNNATDDRSDDRSDDRGIKMGRKRGVSWCERDHVFVSVIMCLWGDSR